MCSSFARGLATPHGAPQIDLHVNEVVGVSSSTSPQIDLHRLPQPQMPRVPHLPWRRTCWFWLSPSPSTSCYSRGLATPRGARQTDLSGVRREEWRDRESSRWLTGKGTTRTSTCGARVGAAAVSMPHSSTAATVSFFISRNIKSRCLLSG
jgi:hypothetical protein